MTSPQPCPKKELGPKSELILSAVTVLYAALAIAFHFPKIQTALMPVFTVWNFLGLQQRWNLFAPALPASTEHLIGIVTLADGAKLVFEPPHPSNHPLLERNLYSRYLKWEADSLLSAPYRPYLPKLCSHILEEFSFSREQAKVLRVNYGMDSNKQPVEED